MKIANIIYIICYNIFLLFPIISIFFSKLNNFFFNSAFSSYIIFSLKFLLGTGEGIYICLSTELFSLLRLFSFWVLSFKFFQKLKKVFEKENVIQNSLTGIVYSDFELNNLSYKEALERDKRNFMQYYISLIKFKQPILFSFYPCKDYNTMIIKVDIFMLSLAIIYAMNALFFNDSTIHQIYEDGGEYNLSYFMPIILSSFIITLMNSKIIFRKLNQIKRMILDKYVFFLLIFSY